jgi:hypothetical protein
MADVIELAQQYGRYRCGKLAALLRPAGGSTTGGSNGQKREAEGSSQTAQTRASLAHRWVMHLQTEDYGGHVNPVGPRPCYDEGPALCRQVVFRLLAPALT